MTTIIDHEMLWRQFGAAIDDFGNALRDCPDELWEKRLWEDQPDQWVASGFSTYWYLCYHMLFWLDLYLTGAEEGFAPPAPFDLVEMESGEVLPRPIRARSCSAIWNTAAEDARRRLALCQTSRQTTCADSPGESYPLQNFYCTICVTCKSMLLSYACSWDSRRDNLRSGHPGQRNNLDN